MTGARLAVGPTTARIVVVVDSARKWDVVKEGLLVGPAGSRFEEWLQGVGLRRSDVYITTIVTDRVVKDNLRTKPKAEVEYAVELLHQRLAKLTDPWVIVPMDEVALTALTGKRKLSKWRGSILQYVDARGRAIKVIPTIHPQETFRAATLERWCRYDWARIAGDSQFRELRLPERALHIRPTLRDVQQFVKDLPAFEAVSLDIETPRQVVLREKVLKSGKTKVSKAYGASRITCIAFAPAANWAICVPTTLDYWGNKADLALVWSLVKAVCGHGVPKVLQNGLFDRYHLKRERDIDVVNHRWDTLCLSHAWDSASKHSLAKLASIWTREPYWKDDAKDLDEDDGECAFEDVKSIDDFWRYNCVEESTPVLMADFTWKPIKDITTGEQILSVDEHGGQQNKGEGSRRWRVATVTKTAAARKACLEIITKSGRRLVLTPDHKVLVGNSGKYWVDAGDLRCTPKFKSQLMQAVEPWADDLSWDRAWFGGFLDGEGSIGGTHMRGGQNGKHHGYGSINFAQKPGAVFDRAVRVLASHGFKASYRGPCKSTGNVHYGYIRNGARNTIRLLGMFKPTRLQENYKRIVEAGHIRAVCLDGDQIVSIKKIGVRNVVDITTTTSTFIANGYVVHNCRDAAVTYEIKDRIVPVLEADGKLARYMQHYPPLFDPLLKMMLDGVRQDPHTKAAHLQQLDVDLAAHRANLDIETTTNITYKDGTPYGKSIIAKKAISNKLLQEVLYDVLRLPKRERLRKDTGEKSTTADSVALRSLALRYKATCGRLVELILAYRRTGKIKDFIKEGVADADHRVRCQYKFTTECLLPEAEVLTPHGWRQIQTLQPDTQVAQWDSVTGDVTYAEANVSSWKFDGEMVQAGSSFHRQVYTPDHRIPTIPYGTKSVQVVSAESLYLTNKHTRIPVSGFYQGGTKLDVNFLRLCAAIQADGSYHGKGIVFNLRRPRKITRLRQLCDNVGITMTEWQTKFGWFRGYIPSTLAAAYQDFLGPEKTFSYKLLEFSYPALLGWLREIAYWDGCTSTGKQFRYYSTQRVNCEWVQTIAHLCGHSASITQRGGSTSFANAQPVWCCWVSHKITRQSQQEDYTKYPYQGKVWCVTVPSGFILARYQNTIVVTGNTHRLASSKNPGRTGQNLQNVDRSVRRHYLSDSGTVFIELDASQAEDRIVKILAYLLTGNKNLLWRAQAQPWENDEHKRAAAAIFKIALDAVTKPQRTLGKTSRHAGNYGMGGKTHSENLLKQGVVITPDEAQTMIDAIMAADPEIAEWQRATRIAVMRDRAITNVWGWTLSFQYDRLDDSVYRRAYAYRPQSDCGIMTNMNGIVPFWAWLADQRRRQRTVSWLLTRLALQVHDAIIVCCPPETAYDVASFLKRHLETPLPYDGGRCPLVIPATLKIGTDWSMSKEYVRFPSREELETDCQALLAAAVQREAVAVG